jgi:hypothetical protein
MINISPMTFDNSKTIITFRVRQVILTILLLAYIILAFVAEIIRFPLLGMSETVLTLILVGIWILFTFVPALLSYQFVYFSDDTERIVIRYFNAGMLGGKKNAVEIDKSSFAGYRTESSFFGLVTSITLLQNFREGVAKYPPVYISALTKEQKSNLFHALNSYSPGR